MKLQTKTLRMMLLGSLITTSLLPAMSLASDSASFNITAQIIEAISVQNTAPLNFGIIRMLETTQDIVVNPADSGNPSGTEPAKFSATGEPDFAVKGNVVETQITLSCQEAAKCDQESFNVDTFTYGGDMNSDGDATLNDQGALSNLLVGATAHVNANQKSGNYQGTGTFRVIYQ